MKNGLLYVVATPIGNLRDITFRAIDVLNAVDIIACEDTRVTRKLLAHYKIITKTIAYHHHTSEEKTQNIVNEIASGKNVAIVTDAGTPGICDPGNRLVAHALEKGINVIPISGPTAISTLICVSGIDMQKFLFLAYPPHKKGRKTFFVRIAGSDMPVVYYDSVHRVIKNLQLLQEVSSHCSVIVGRELTKIHEEIVRGDIGKVIEYFTENKDHVRGEFVIIVYK